MKNTTKSKKRLSYRNLSYENKRIFWGLIFLLPWMIGLLFFFLIPLGKTFFYSFFSMTLETGGFKYTWVGLENFKYALTVDPEFNSAIITALAEAFRSWPFQIFVSLFVAMLLNGSYKGRGFFRVIFIIPIILATGLTQVELADVNVAKEASQSFLNVDGLMAIFTSSGMPASLINGILSVVNDIFEVITTSGVQILIFLAGLQGISPSLYEGAKMEGCTQFESFCKITLPMISPMILVCTIYSLADSFAGAEISETISNVTFSNSRYGLGSAMSVIYFLVSTIIVLVVSLIISRGVYYYDK